ncbi:helix-turn-helix domain-containing protein [Flavihumibacter petaseus]|uniref:Putative AraC family transcriptional regulator n=1 Tax=Flavihumibacter petaseus NBRC 106054 TaxID=1220578 RepID=A0A0E9MYF9_9BACT|nr:AraC family transcriptional regulator [Flavihumibacter petaseus]GAO42629.1 putative AraC family transcriptional regulator [Flavihumibacter petaseus NBRC 106054]
MVNFFERVLQNPNFYRQFTCNNSLITAFNCPLDARLMKTQFADLWTQYNCLFYVIDGRKIWHTAQGSHDLQKNTCVFVRKGAFILEQMFDVGFCVVLFFIPDEFICDTLKARSRPLADYPKHYDPLMFLNNSETLAAFFHSMSSYFAETNDPDPSLLELKFRELILTIADNPRNAQLLSYFCSLLHEPRSLSLQRVMEDNYCFNLKLEAYARLCNRSLSAFKRDFQQAFGQAPGKWLMEKRLLHAKNLLNNHGKSISEAAFESGFENNSHFSRAFKQRFGVAPSGAKAIRQD